eukprot:8892143-Lingulodinium_polyedra.AAC.1
MGKDIVATLHEFSVLRQHGQPGIHRTSVLVGRSNRKSWHVLALSSVVRGCQFASGPTRCNA